MASRRRKPSSSLHDTILLASAECLARANQGRILCPICEGGRTNEVTLQVWRDNKGVGFKCHRASCGVSGVIGHSGGPGNLQNLPKKRPAKRVPALDEMTEYEWGGLLALYPDLFPALEKYHPRTARGRLFLPILGDHGQHRGYWAKRLPGVNCEPKVLVYPGQDYGTGMAWYFPDWPAGRRSIVVVEDPLSAAKVAYAGVVCVAANGTHINNAKALELTKDRSRPIIIALDEDATQCAYRLARRYAAWGNFSVLELRRDLKLETTSRIQEIIRP